MGIRFRAHRNGSATLAGVDRKELRSILDGASIHYHEDLAEARKESWTSERTDWILQQLKVLECIKQAVDDAITAAHPPHPPPSRESRLRAVVKERQERILIDQIVDGIAEAVRTSGKPRDPWLDSDEPRDGDVVRIADVRHRPFIVTGSPHIHAYGTMACWRLPTTEGDVSYDGDASIYLMDPKDIAEEVLES